MFETIAQWNVPMRSDANFYKSIKNSKKTVVYQSRGCDSLGIINLCSILLSNNSLKRVLLISLQGSASFFSNSAFVKELKNRGLDAKVAFLTLGELVLSTSNLEVKNQIDSHETAIVAWDPLLWTFEFGMISSSDGKISTTAMDFILSFESAQIHLLNVPDSYRSIGSLLGFRGYDNLISRIYPWKNKVYIATDKAKELELKALSNLDLCQPISTDDFTSYYAYISSLSVVKVALFGAMNQCKGLFRFIDRNVLTVDNFSDKNPLTLNFEISANLSGFGHSFLASFHLEKNLSFQRNQYLNTKLFFSSTEFKAKNNN